jgi:Asp-tRNA(Asn)/Glu-tRNA(Gln) amidotransferase A subunit family amidase
MPKHPSKMLTVIVTGISCFLLGTLFQSDVTKNPITRDIIANAEKVIGIEFTDVKRDSMIDALGDQLKNYRNIRAQSLPNDIPPAFLFNPIPAGFKFETKHTKFKTSPVRHVILPPNIEDVAFYSIEQLSELIRTRKITSLQLTQMYISRIKRYNPMLKAVITITEDTALVQAREADKEIAAGKYRGMLHGIPYGAKDLLAAKGYKTTWGSVPYKDQYIDEDATVIKKLRDAGAVLVAKTTLGEIANGDVWFGGMTRNPWDTSKGSSGSSAGTASGTAAGLFAFGIGSETWGSIVSPSTVCGTTGLRPTFGRVSRKGAMALSWTMDKLGPICRTVEDCAIVFNAICGKDPADPATHDVPFNYSPAIDFKHIKVGYLKTDFDSVKDFKNFDDSTFMKLAAMGVDLIPVELPKYPTNDLSIILTAEAAAAFDDLTRSGKDDLMVLQSKDAWPNLFRAARFIPAVEYIQANRIRYRVIQDMKTLMEKVDIYIAPPFEGDNLLMTNLTGHPCVVLPNGFTKDGLPSSITLIGNLFDEGRLLAFAKKYQDATDFHLKHPKLQ